MKAHTRERLHLGLAIFFAVQIPLAVGLYLYDLKLFNQVGIIYLVVVSQWALVGTHLAGASAEIPDER